MVGMRMYTPEFRESAVAMVVTQGLSIRQSAQRLEIPFHTLDAWIRKARKQRSAVGPPSAPKTLAEAEVRMRALEAEVRRLTLEKDLLKKAAAYFAREQL